MNETFGFSSIEEVRHDIFKFRNDVYTLRLEKYYSAPSYSEILGVSRKESSHSNFLAWLLNDKESHSLSDFPMRKFLEILVSHCPSSYKLEQSTA